MGLSSVPLSGSLLSVEVSIDKNLVDVYLHMFVNPYMTITPK